MTKANDNHTVTSSPLMCLEFIIIHTLIWGFLLCIIFYALSLFLVGFCYLPIINILYYLYFSPFLYYIRILLEWPGVMLTALIVTIIRSFHRKTTVTMSDGMITIRRHRLSQQLSLANFIRQETKESYINVHLIGWVFRKRFLVFGNDMGKEVRYRLYEFSAKDLEQVIQLITRVNRTENLDENDKTQIMMNAFQNAIEIPLNPEQILSRERRFLLRTLLCALPAFLIFSYIFYWMFNIPKQFDSASPLLSAVGFGSLFLTLGSFILLCRTLWTLLNSTIRSRSCPAKIAFTGTMFQIDNTVYSVNRILKIHMTRPYNKPPKFHHYLIKITTMEGVHRYWLGSTAILDQNIWLAVCRNMQRVLVSCPAKLIYK